MLSRELVDFILKFFHLSPLDYVIAILVILLTFATHMLDLAQMAGKKYLEFVRWRAEYQKELPQLKRAQAYAIDDEHVKETPRLSA